MQNKDRYRLPAHKRGYDHRRRKARRLYLDENPLCVMCLEDGHIEPATVVDHVVPHLQRAELFWDTANWQSLCKKHHDSTKQREEKRGHAIGCDADGIPLEPNKHWR